MAKDWNDLAKELIPADELEAVRKETALESEQLDLKALRKALGLTQMQAAELLSMPQSELSRFENREDHRLSYLRRYVEALGGKLKIVVELGDKSFTLELQTGRNRKSP